MSEVYFIGHFAILCYYAITHTTKCNIKPIFVEYLPILQNTAEFPATYLHQIHHVG